VIEDHAYVTGVSPADREAEEFVLNTLGCEIVTFN
jgi:hypothetical protein